MLNPALPFRFNVAAHAVERTTRTHEIPEQIYSSENFYQSNDRFVYQKIGMKKITIVAGTTNRLLDVLIIELKKNQISIEIVQQSNFVTPNIFLAWTIQICLGILDFIKIIKSRSSITAYHFFGIRSLSSTAILAIIKLPYVIHFWGSDFFYWKNRNNFLLRFALRHAKQVTFANTTMLKDAKKTFGSGINYNLLRFGLEAIDLIDNHKNNEKHNEIRVIVGTNSQPGQQHLKIIDALEKITAADQDNILFIFPLNYGDTSNKELIKKRLLGTKIKYQIIENFLSGKDLAKFRINTNILIQTQKTDAMSGAMLESLYAGAKVITGSWLPYDDLRNRGIDWIEVDDISEITLQLPYLIRKSIDTKKNKIIISSMTRWSDLTPDWINCYSQQQGNE